MDFLTHRFFSRILYISLLTGAGMLLFNPRHRAPALVLYGLFAVLILYHHWRYYTPEIKHKNGRYFLVAELLLALGIQYFDHTGFVEIYMFIVIADALLAYGPGFSVPLTAVAMICYVGMLYQKSTAATAMDFWVEIDSSLLLSLIYIGVILSARHNIMMNRKSRSLARELAEKTGELETAYEQLRAYTAELEETADLRAREQLMHRLHDKLGHLLTTAAISSQTAGILVEKEPAAARERLAVVTEQIQSAMQSLRDVIRGNPAPAEYPSRSFLNSLNSLLTETETRTGIVINHNFTDTLETDLEILSGGKRSFLYNALMEGLTNGIRHGGATCFHFRLKISGGMLYFYLHDDGRGCKNPVPGYGLNRMRKVAESLGAEVELNSAEGCTLSIRLPVH